MPKDNGLKKRIFHYIKAVSRKVPVKQVILFGSYAQGRQEKHSDIDLAVFSSKFSDKTHLQDIQFLWTEAARVDSQIEPLAFSTAEIKNADPRSFLGEILKTGKIVYKK